MTTSSSRSSTIRSSMSNAVRNTNTMKDEFFLQQLASIPMRARSGGRGRRRRGRRTSTAAALAGMTALGDVGSRGGALGGDVDGGGARGARAVGGAGERTAGGRKGEGGRKLGNIWGGGGLFSRGKPPPGTKGPFVPGGGFTRDKRPPLLSRVVASPGTKGVFGRAGKIPSPWPTFSPGWIYHPGQKRPVFPCSRLMLCLFLFLFTSLLKLAFIC